MARGLTGYSRHSRHRGHSRGRLTHCVIVLPDQQAQLLGCMLQRRVLPRRYALHALPAAATAAAAAAVAARWAGQCVAHPPAQPPPSAVLAGAAAAAASLPACLPGRPPQLAPQLPPQRCQPPLYLRPGEERECGRAVRHEVRADCCWALLELSVRAKERSPTRLFPKLQRQRAHALGAHRSSRGRDERVDCVELRRVVVVPQRLACRRRERAGGGALRTK